MRGVDGRERGVRGLPWRRSALRGSRAAWHTASSVLQRAPRGGRQRGRRVPCEHLVSRLPALRVARMQRGAAAERHQQQGQQ